MTQQEKIKLPTIQQIKSRIISLPPGTVNLERVLIKTGKKMQDWMIAHLEALVLTEPWLYFREIQERLTNDLTLQPRILSGLSSICKALATLELDRKSATRVAQERFTPPNLQRRHVYNVWKHTVNMSNVYFLDETGFHAKTDLQRMAQSFPNERIPLVT